MPPSQPAVLPATAPSPGLPPVPRGVAGTGPQGPWRRPFLFLAGGLLVTEAASHLLHPGGGGMLGLAALAGGWWWLRRGQAGPRARLPENLEGWFDRCEAVLEQFTRLEHQAESPQEERRRRLDDLRVLARRRPLTVAVAGIRPPAQELQPTFASALRCPHGLRLLWGHPLQPGSAGRRWPEGFEQADVLIHHLELPLSATDLRWLEALPDGQPAWLLVGGTRVHDPQGVATELASLWPAADARRLLLWDGGTGTVGTSLEPLAAWLAREGDSLPEATARRCLENLHGRWQAELEQLRRREWMVLQRRTQWVVAAGVVVAPLPSLDLLVLAAANGLMLQEMARLWDCPWSLDQLRAASTELARACLALGVVEWSSQALAGAVKLHGATWLVGGALQALSAAYLTRVVGHAMADVLALSAGVAAPDLESIKRQAPVLVARAAEAERLDWGSFLREGRRWLQQQGDGGPGRIAPPLQGTS